MVAQKRADRLEILDFPSDVIRTALAVIYGGNLCKRPSNDCGHLVRVAQFGQKYDVESLADACLQVLHLDANLFNVAEILSMVESANFGNDTQLRENLIEYVAL
jgi:hypothetical protein